MRYDQRMAPKTTRSSKPDATAPKTAPKPAQVSAVTKKLNDLAERYAQSVRGKEAAAASAAPKKGAPAKKKSAPKKRR